MKKILSVVIILSLLVGAVPMAFAATYSPYIRILVPTDIPEINAGEGGEFELSVKNVGVYGAYPLTIKFGDGHPFRADSSELVQDIKYLGGNSTQTVKFKVTPNPLAQDRIYEFDVIFTYKDSDENVQSNTEKAYIKINNQNTEPTIAIESVTTKKSQLEKNQQNILSIKIRNKGTLSANKLKATLSGFSSDGIMLDGESDFKVIGNLKSENAYYVMYNIKTSDSFNYGTHTMVLSLEYNDDYGTAYKKDTNIFLTSEDPDKAGAGHNVAITDVTYPSSVEQEKDFEIKYKVTNISERELKNLTLEYVHPENFVAKKDSKVIVDLQPGETKEVTALMLARKGTAENTYHTNIVVRSGNKEAQLASEYVGIYVLAYGQVSGGNSLEITGITHPSSVEQDKDFELGYKITNKSDEAMNRVTVQYDHPDAFVAKKNSKVVLDLAPGETKEVKVLLCARKGSTENTYHTNLLAFVGDSETPFVKEYVGIYVLDESDGSKVSKANRPKLIIEDYEYGGSAKAGEEFELVMNVKNTSATQYTKNIKIVLSSDGVFTPVNSSSSIFVDSIAPGETKKVSIKLRTKSDAAVQIYTVGVKMDYEDGEGKAFDAQNNPFTESENLSVQVIQDAVLSLNGPFMDAMMYVGDRYYINAQYYNEGKARVTNLKVRIEGVPVRENSSYIGNFDPGQSDEYSISFTPEEEGDFEGKLIFEYQNPIGEIETKELEFSYFVLPASEKPIEDGSNGNGGMYPMPTDEEETSGINWSLILGIVLGVLLIVVIVVVMVIKGRKRAQSVKELESMFEEEK